MWIERTTDYIRIYRDVPTMYGIKKTKDDFSLKEDGEVVYEKRLYRLVTPLR